MIDDNFDYNSYFQSAGQHQPDTTRQQFCRHNSTTVLQAQLDNSFAGTTLTTVLQTQLRHNNSGSELAIDNRENPTTTRRTTWRININNVIGND